MTCVWTALNTADGGLIAAGLAKGEIQRGALTAIDITELSSIYITSAYFVTTTMTTVGYGDIYASSSDVEKNFQLMLFVMVLEFSGILLFSLTSLRVQQLKSKLQFETMLKENMKAMSWYL